MKVPMEEKSADKAIGRTRGGLNTKLHAIIISELKLGNNKFNSSRFARRCKQRQPQNMANITSDLLVRK